MIKFAKRLALLLALCMISGCFLTVGAEEAEDSAVLEHMLAWYTFDDAENPWADASGNENHLSAKGEPTLVEDGMYGSAVHFDGMSALYAATGENGDFLDALADTTKQFTLTYWLRTTKEDMQRFDVTGWRRIVSNGADWGHSGGPAAGFTLINNPDDPNNPGNVVNNPVIHYTNNDYNTHVYANDYPVNVPFDTSWAFVAVTVNAEAGTIEYYLNGMKLESFSVRQPILFANAAAPLAFGAAYNPNNADLELMHTFAGSLDQIGVFDKVLDPTEIAFVMNNLEAPPEKPDDPTQPGGETLQFGAFCEGQNVVFRFDGVRNINRSITSNAYCLVSTLDKAVKLQFWGDGAMIQQQMERGIDRFSLDEYRYMKIKYCSGTQNSDSVFMFSTVQVADGVSNGMLHIERKQHVWDEQIFDMTTLEGWNGQITGWQLMPAPQRVEGDTIFIEYIAFFKTKEAAEAFGGLTEAQKAGEDPVSLYFKNGYVNPYLHYGPGAVKTEGAVPLWAWAVAGGGVLVALVCVIALIVSKKKHKKGKDVTEA